MSAGGQLGVGLNMTKFICALLIGNAILGVYTGILGYIGCKTGLTLDLMARHAFGKKGSWLCSAIITFTQMGWFGVGIAMFSIPVAEFDRYSGGGSCYSGWWSYDSLCLFWY